MSRREEIALSYGNIVLRSSDVALLKGPKWLNDTVIEFWFEYLSDDLYKDYDSCLFVGPGVTQCIKASQTIEQVAIFLDPLNAKEREVIFFAVNDNRVYSQCGGTHWSLIVYSKKEKIILHFDSLAGSNIRQACQFARKLWDYFPCGKHGHFDDVDCLQQDNGWDCGIFVLCHAELVMQNFLSHGTIQGCPLLEEAEANAKRSAILATITSLNN